jgi:hypothetical protein
MIRSLRQWSFKNPDILFGRENETFIPDDYIAFVSCSVGGFFINDIADNIDADF